MSFDKNAIDRVMERLHIQSVGNGYVDLICPKENVETFIDEMSALGVRIAGFTWWCLVTETHEACGYGGPKNSYGDGWYSEVAPTEAMISFSNNEEIRDFLIKEWPNSPNYKLCYHPGFWIENE